MGCTFSEPEILPVRAAVPIERVSEARTTFEECVNLYYKKPEVETLLLSPKRDHVAHALRYTLAASFAPLEDHHADGTLSDREYYLLMETRLRVLNWILAVGETSVAKPPVIAEAKQDDSDTASVVEEEGVRPKLTLQHPNFGSMPFEEPIERVDLDQILISLHEIDEVKKLFASRRTALYPTARIALSSLQVVHAGDRMCEAACEDMQQFSTSFRSVLNIHFDVTKPIVQTVMVSESEEHDPRSTFPSCAAVALFAAHTLAFRAKKQHGSHGSCLHLIVDAVEMCSVWGRDQVSLFFMLPWALMDLYGCSVVLIIRSVQLLGAATSHGEHMRACFNSMIQEGKNETKQRDPSTKLFVIGCTHRPFEVSFEVRDCFSAKLFASSTKPSKPADDLHKQLRFATLDGWFERSTSTRRSRRKPQSAQASSVAAGRQTLQVHRVAGAADFSNHNRHADMISLPQSGSNSPRAAASSSNARRTASTRRSEDSEDVEVEVDTDPKPRSRVITHSGSAATGKPGITTHSAASSESTSITSTQSLRSPASKSVTKSDQQASPRGEAAQPTHLRTIAV